MQQKTEVAKRQVCVLKNLKLLIQSVLSSPQGKIYLVVMDVSDCDVDYVLSLAGEIKVKPFVILNNFPLEAGNCYSYENNMITITIIYKNNHYHTG
jgi:hypothetical protein